MKMSKPDRFRCENGPSLPVFAENLWTWIVFLPIPLGFALRNTQVDVLTSSEIRWSKFRADTTINYNEQIFNQSNLIKRSAIGGSAHWHYKCHK